MEGEGDDGWRKGSRSGNSGHCLEVCKGDFGSDVRDSKDPEGPVLHFTRKEIAAFIAAVKDGAYNL